MRRFYEILCERILLSSAQRISSIEFRAVADKERSAMLTFPLQQWLFVKICLDNL